MIADIVDKVREGKKLPSFSSSKLLDQQSCNGQLSL